MNCLYILTPHPPMRNFLKFLQSADLIGLAIELGVAIFILVTFVRCSFGI